MKHWLKVPGIGLTQHSISLALCLLLASTSCMLETPSIPQKLENGWKIQLPDPFEVLEQSDSTCLIGDPRQINVRTPHTVVIRWPDIDSLRDNSDWEKLSFSGDSPIFYQEERLAGGSGGDEFVFRAWKKVRSQLIYLEERYQSEGEDSPSFVLGKGIIRTAIKDVDNIPSHEEVDALRPSLDILQGTDTLNSPLSFDHIEILNLPIWYSAYDTLSKRDCIVKGKFVDWVSKTPDSLLKHFNEGKHAPLELIRNSGDTLYVRIMNSDYISERSGSTGAKEFLASATYTLTEIENVNVIYFDFEEGSHAVPGAYARGSFKNFHKIEID